MLARRMQAATMTLLKMMTLEAADGAHHIVPQFPNLTLPVLVAQMTMVVVVDLAIRLLLLMQNSPNPRWKSTVQMGLLHQFVVVLDSGCRRPLASQAELLGSVYPNDPPGHSSTI